MKTASEKQFSVFVQVLRDDRILHMDRFEKYDDQLFIISVFSSLHDLSDDFKRSVDALVTNHKAKRLMIGMLRKKARSDESSTR